MGDGGVRTLLLGGVTKRGAGDFLKLALKIDYESGCDYEGWTSLFPGKTQINAMTELDAQKTLTKANPVFILLLWSWLMSRSYLLASRWNTS